MADDKEFLIRVKADIRQAVRDLKKVTKEVQDTGKGAGKSKENLDGMGKSMGTLVKAAAAYLSVSSAVKLLRIADAYQVLDQRIRTATKATGDYAQVSGEIFRISNQNGVALESTVSLFQNLARTAPELNASNDEILTLTNSVQQLGVISGATNSQLSAGLLQFSQGLAAGVFRAEEFNSIIENLPEVANRIAKGMNLTVGQLRQGVLEGNVLSKDVFDSLLKQSEDINKEFSEIPTSMERATQSLINSFQKLAGSIDKRTGVTGAISDIFSEIAEGMNFLSASINTQSVDDVLTALEHYQEILDFALEADIPFISDLDIANALEKINELNAKLDEFQEKKEEVAQDEGTPLVETNEEQKSIDKLIDKLRAQKETMRLTSEEAVIYQLNLKHASDAEIELALAHINAIEAQRKQQELMAEGQKVIDSTRTEMEELAKTLSDIDRLYESGALGIVGSTEALDNYARAVFAAQDAVEDFGEESKDTFSELEAAVKGWGDEFTNTLADMVVEGKANFSDLAKSIIKDLLKILIYQNLVKPTLGYFDVGTNHSGGLAGTGATRSVSPLVFAGAPRYHTGGLAGLRQNEVPAILERGEEVLTRNDPRHVLNGGGSSGLKVELVNKGGAKEATQATSRNEAGDLVISIMLDDLERAGPYSTTFRNKIAGG